MMKKSEESSNPETAMLLDKSPVPALHGLIRPHERPVFECHEDGRQFAAAGDLDDRGRGKIAQTPRELVELKPD